LTNQLELVTVQKYLKQPIEGKITLLRVQLEPVTVQQGSRKPIDSSARVNPAYSSARACDSSKRFKVAVGQ